MRGDDLAKHAAATNKKGVVGSNGKNAPIKASKTKNIPDIFNNIKNLSLVLALFTYIVETLFIKGFVIQI